MVHHTGVPSAQFLFRAVCRQAVAAAGWRAMTSSHSFRIAAVSSTAAAGFGQEAIKVIGQWHSYVYRYRSYIRPFPAQKGEL